ncbi:uncharacterized protein LOC129565661 [Sitodiplosis mosellana]|uniref:uncharacterized protein LOC129565661 n=1 Tax=Sitodiplosis mosellana TaxID=263140 RepID=UPI002443BDD0|nr:uncharacterized protein LOC129565661 [Sitodiplosis mosellana]
MARLTLLTIGLAAFCAFNGVNCDGFVQTLELKSEENEKERKFYIKFSNENECYPGDRVIATNSQNQQWTVAQNVTQNITYPRSGVGAVITYIEIVVNQSSNLGRGFVTSGGIGQRQIVITIEAQKTLYFLQTTTIYGY